MEWEDEMESGQQQESEDEVESGEQPGPEDEVEFGEQPGPEDEVDLEGERLLPLAEVQHLVPLSKSTIYKMVGDGHSPKPVKIGVRRVGWRRRLVVAWIKHLHSAD